MKKLLLSLVLIGTFGGFISIAAASNTDCKEVNFDNGVDACVNINDAGSDERELETDLDGGSQGLLRCDIMTPDSILVSVPGCNGTFEYDKNDAGRIKLWIRYNEQAPEDREGKPSSNSQRTYPQRIYDFDDEGRLDDNLDDNEDNNDSDTSDYTITASPSDPEENERVDITVKAMDGSSTDTSYRGTVKFKVEKKSGSSRTTASSSLYQLSTTSYKFTSSNAGRKTFSDLIKFKDDSYSYRLTVYDESDSSTKSYKIFTLNGENNNNDSDTSDYTITASPSDPEENERVDITVKAMDGSSTDTSYRGTVKFKIEKKSGSSRTTASSSLYQLSTTSYKFTSSNAGRKTFSDLIKFKDDSYDYRLTVYDESDSSTKSYKIFTLNGENNSDTDNFYVTTDDSTPTTSQFVDLTVKARNGTATDTAYRGTVKFKIEKKSGSSRTTASSSLYELSTTSYKFTSSNAGRKTFNDLIKFKDDSYDYRLTVYDESDSSTKSYKIFTLNGENNSDTDNFYVTTDDSTPTTSQFVDLTVKARNGTATDTSYRGTVFFEIYYKASGSATRVKTTSSSYYEMEGNYEDDGYTFTSSNNGTKTFSNIIKFKRNNYSYKVVVYDKDEEFEGYKVFTIGSISGGDSDVDGFTASQLRTVESILEARPNVIDRMESQYSRLRNSSRRQNMSDDLEQDMEDIVDDKSSRTYEDFAAFYEGFLERYRYTVSIR